MQIEDTEGERLGSREGVNSLKQTLKKISFLKVLEIVFVVALTFAPLALGHAAGLSDSFACDSNSGQNCSITTVNGLIRRVLTYMLGTAFGVAVLFLVVGGFWYITSAGNEETAEKGRNTAINAIIGIVIIILSWVIINVVTNLVTDKPNTAG